MRIEIINDVILKLSFYSAKIKAGVVCGILTRIVGIPAAIARTNSHTRLITEQEMTKQEEVQF